MKLVLKEENEVIACACDDPAFKAQMEGLKQMTTMINLSDEVEKAWKSSMSAFGSSAPEYANS